MTRKPATPSTERGKKATFDRKTGAVSGSGAGIGNPDSGEDYASDLDTGSGSDRKAGGPSNAA